MFKFNSDHILTGQIKQILNTFNLPSYKIYTKEFRQYFNDTGTEHPGVVEGLYIKENKIQSYSDGTWTDTMRTYAYNDKILNITKRLNITNNIYDNHTHEYLGNFLRFQRDFLGVDLMPLYNCFGKNVCNHIDIPIDTKDQAGNYILQPHNGQRISNRHVFWSKDPDYIVYAVPVKFFKKYTIALDCNCKVETCCGFYNDYLDELPSKYEELNKYKKWNADHTSYELALLARQNLSQELSNNTYKQYTNLRFNNPILWDGLSIETLNKTLKDLVGSEIEPILETDSEETRAEKQSKLERAQAYKNQLLKKEADLKLFIKIPIYNTTSIVVLEGDYTEYNNFIYRPITTEVHYSTLVYDEEQDKEVIQTKKVLRTKWERHQNHFVTNYETSLLGEGATPVEVVNVYNPEVEEREFKPISPLQLLMLNTGESYPFADRLLEYLSGNVITDFDTHTDNIKRVQKVMELNENQIDYKGMWEDKMRNILYDYMMNGKPTGEFFNSEIAHDVLGYVDKDVEKFYTAWKHEYCKDRNGNLIPLTEKERAYDENGNPLFDEYGRAVYNEVPLYREVNLPLTEADKNLLLEARSFLLMVNDVANIPMYKEVYKPVCTISNVDIYEDEEDN